MSRSRKKTPIIKYGGLSGGKRAANRKARHTGSHPYIGKGNLHKKVYEQYNVNDIVDYADIEAIKQGSEKGLLRHDEATWAKYFYHK